MTRSGGPNFLGARHAPFVVAEDPNATNFRVRDVALPADWPRAGFAARSELRSEVDRFQRFLDKAGGDPAAALDEHYEQAHTLMQSKEAQEAFDIGREDGTVRDAYGRNPFGQRLLLARRLVQAGVPFVTINDGGWDHHVDVFGKCKKRLPDWDDSVAGLIRDLDEQGMLDDTHWSSPSASSATPKINKDAGRDHWSNAMSVLFAGGGTPRAGRREH